MVLRGGMVIDMPMPNAILEYLSALLQNADQTSGASFEMGNYEYMLNELVGVDEAAKWVLALDADDKAEYKKGVPKEVRHAMIFHMMEWRYDEYEHWWISEGDLSVATMGEHNVWRTLRGKMAIDRKSGRILLYLHLGKKQWYFFEYRANQGVMSLASREELGPEATGIQTVVQELKDSEKRIKEGGKEFILQLDNQMKAKSAFVERFREFDD
jgi:hypothetical protein